MKSQLRNTVIQLTGYWMYRRDHLPIGCDLVTDIRYKIKLPINTIFDVGANVGQTVLRFHNDFPLARIYSFEPVLNTFNQLRKNVSRFPNTQYFQMALGDTNNDQEIKTFTGKDSLLNSLNPVSMNAEGKIEVIHVNTGDDFCREHQIESIDLLKIDTEGYELQVLHGFIGMMKESKIAAVYCEVGFNEKNKRNTFMSHVLDYLKEFRFQFYGLYDIYNKCLNTGSDYGSVLFIRV